MKIRNELWGQAVGIAGILGLLYGFSGEKALAERKDPENAFIVYDPQMKTSAIKTISVGYAPEGGRYTAAQRRLLAKRAATVRAYRNLLQATQAVRPVLTPGVTVIEIAGYLQGAQVLETRYDENGKAEVEMILPLGNVAGTLEGTQKVFSKTKYSVYEVEKGKPISKEEYEKLFSPTNEGGD